MIPAWARVAGRQVLVTNGDGIIVAGVRYVLGSNADGPIVAASPLEAGMLGRRLIDVLGPSQPLTTFGAAAGVLEIPLADGTPRLRDRARPLVVQRRARRSSIRAARRSRPGGPIPR